VLDFRTSVHTNRYLLEGNIAGRPVQAKPVIKDIAGAIKGIRRGSIGCRRRRIHCRRPDVYRERHVVGGFGITASVGNPDNQPILALGNIAVGRYSEFTGIEQGDVPGDGRRVGISHADFFKRRYGFVSGSSKLAHG